VQSEEISLYSGVELNGCAIRDKHRANPVPVPRFMTKRADQNGEMMER